MLAEKRKLLACHRSQKEWLDVQQGMNAYLEEMEQIGRMIGRRSRKFKAAEGWSRHMPIGFCPPDYDPLRAVLRKFVKEQRKKI